jgi:hypothetical protein
MRLYKQLTLMLTNHKLFLIDLFLVLIGSSESDHHMSNRLFIFLYGIYRI